LDGAVSCTFPPSPPGPLSRSVGRGGVGVIGVRSNRFATDHGIHHRSHLASRNHFDGTCCYLVETPLDLLGSVLVVVGMAVEGAGQAQHQAFTLVMRQIQRLIEDPASIGRHRPSIRRPVLCADGLAARARRLRSPPSRAG
jgi:hypothetical protein